ncbi:TonB-dependent receptor family protein [Thiohalophilus thiocyanatoxydans]|uniref:Iron complex outermembrane receptor protein n=1 Tax=Thiohalophilus thiocyanatoxydans TaxID=381308 RepID=A0A4R8ISQ6_9GAMM|nr:TonB-dependent receptor [Thiohalophilus thiocyanatoxydans]TDY04006.1 iron complex outermembrane receptor protein [Thiohalophilus thiocyanatoxydans]
MPRPLCLFVLFTTGGLWPGLLAAQEQSEPKAIRITAPLIETRWQEAPSGVTLIEAEDIGEGRAPLQPTDALSLAPGVLVQNRDNFAQNPRVSIRGFGARAPFGIRGVRVRLDGIPLTTVDGQAQIDAIDPSSIESVEVLRGANAVLHGNGSGGLLDYRSRHPRRADRARAEAQLGGFGLRRAHGAFTGEHEALAYRVAGTHLQQAGYRDQSEVERRNAGLYLDHQQGRRNWFAILNHLSNPLADDPGGLTYDEWQDDPEQAAPLASNMDAGQQVDQNIASLGMVHRFDQRDHQLRLQTWLTERDFQQQLPFPGDSLIRYDRRILGGTLHYQRPIGELTLHSQFSLEAQRDDRQRFCRNTDLDPYLCRSGISTDLALDQIERARNTGLGLQLAGPLGERDQGRWIIGARHDRLSLSIADQLQPGGIDNSGERLYRETHYSLGYSHTLNQHWSAFTQFATSFEAPTFTEFANPDGSGFRPNLEPQYSESVEVGLRARQYHYRLEATLFTVRVEDEIIVDDDPGADPSDERTFYRNADRTRRDGIELGARWWPEALPRLQLSGALTWMDARFDDASDKTLPGLPDWTLFLDAEYDFRHGWFAGISTQHIGTRYADDANAERVGSQTATDLRLGRELNSLHHATRLVIGIENLFDAEHLGNLRINASNDRYYEPGAERRFYAGIEISWP